MFGKKLASNRSSYTIEFKENQKGDITIIGNRDALIALSLQLDQAIEDEECVSRKFRSRQHMDRDFTVTFDYQSGQ